MRAPQKVLTSAEMRAVDRRTIELGIPGVMLMENAGSRVVDFLCERFAPLSDQRIVVFCGKGNNGGDGLVVARQLFTRFRPRSLEVILAASADDLKGDAAANLRMLTAAGGRYEQDPSGAAGAATLVIDALLGTGVNGPATGRILESIRAINSRFRTAKVVAVDIPSGLPSDEPAVTGEYVRADHTVTFTAPKLSQVFPPTCDLMGTLEVVPIGTDPRLFQEDESLQLGLVDGRSIRHLLAPRAKDSNKGSFGHILIVAGSRGKTGAAAMAGIAALRAGAGLATVATPESALPAIAAHAPEVMTEALPETPGGAIAGRAAERILELARQRSVVAIGPGLGTDPETARLVTRVFEECEQPLVVDADALNALSEGEWQAPGRLRVLTPHPGEMGRLVGKSVREVQANRLAISREFAGSRRVHLVLKGYRTLLAWPDGRVWVNPTGSPSMATGGTGDILTGMIAGFLGQFPGDPDLAIAAAVYLHGRAGELGADALGEQSLIATDLLKFLPDAIHATRRH